MFNVDTDACITPFKNTYVCLNISTLASLFALVLIRRRYTTNLFSQGWRKRSEKPYEKLFKGEVFWQIILGGCILAAVFLLLAVRETGLILNLLPGSYSKAYDHRLSDHFFTLAGRIKLLCPVQGNLVPSVKHTQSTIQLNVHRIFNLMWF